MKAYLGEDYCFGTGVWCGIKSDLDPKTVELWMYVADIGWQVGCYLTTCILYMHLKLYLVNTYFIRNITTQMCYMLVCCMLNMHMEREGPWPSDYNLNINH